MNNIICKECGKHQTNPMYPGIVKYSNDYSIEVCDKCQKEIENRSNYWYRNYVPTFVDGTTITRIFINKNEFKKYIDSLEISEDYIKCIDNDNTLMEISKDYKHWFVLGYFYSKKNILHYPLFNDLRKLAKYEKCSLCHNETKDNLHIVKYQNDKETIKVCNNCKNNIKNKNDYFYINNINREILIFNDKESLYNHIFNLPVKNIQLNPKLNEVTGDIYDNGKKIVIGYYKSKEPLENINE